MALSDRNDDEPCDAALIERTRSGDIDAYGLLHQRHAATARAVAWRMSRSGSDADDLVSEGFARVLAALQRGNGPDRAFRPYLLSTIRRLAYDRTRREQRETPVESPAEDRMPAVDPMIEGFERDTAVAAYASLPERWRLVLWHTEVEGDPPAKIAALLGISPNAVAALAYRAREGLRQAYLTNHTVAAGEHRECRHIEDRLAGYVRGSLTPTNTERVANHLRWCTGCASAHLELLDVNTSLRRVIVGTVLGPAAVAAGAAASALAAVTTVVFGLGHAAILRPPTAVHGPIARKLESAAHTVVAPTTTSPRVALSLNASLLVAPPVPAVPVPEPAPAIPLGTDATRPDVAAIAVDQ